MAAGFDGFDHVAQTGGFFEAQILGGFHHAAGEFGEIVGGFYVAVGAVGDTGFGGFAPGELAGETSAEIADFVRGTGYDPVFGVEGDLMFAPTSGFINCGGHAG